MARNKLWLDGWLTCILVMIYTTERRFLSGRSSYLWFQQDYLNGNGFDTIGVQTSVCWFVLFTVVSSIYKVHRLSFWMYQSQSWLLESWMTPILFYCKLLSVRLLMYEIQSSLTWMNWCSLYTNKACVQFFFFCRLACTAPLEIGKE